MAESPSPLSRVTRMMAWAWGVLFSLSALGSCLLASLQNTKWAMLDGQAKFLLSVAIGVNWFSILMAFLSKTVARLEAGQPPPTNGTDIFTKASTATTQQNPS